MTKTLLAVGAALAVAVLPAAAGVAGNDALSRQVEVRTGPTAGPAHEEAPKPPASHDVKDDMGGHRPPDYSGDTGVRSPEYGDDKGGPRQRDGRMTGDHKGRGRGRGADDGAGHR